MNEELLFEVIKYMVEFFGMFFFVVVLCYVSLSDRFCVFVIMECGVVWYVVWLMVLWCVKVWIFFRLSIFEGLIVCWLRGLGESFMDIGDVV